MNKEKEILILNIDDVLPNRFQPRIKFNEKNILEEVIYTISLSVDANYDVKEVVFQVDNQEIYKSVIKTIENS